MNDLLSLSVPQNRRGQGQRKNLKKRKNMLDILRMAW